jgi:uncharacterized protein YkwD
MARAARDHVNDIGPKGLFSHTGTDKSTPFTRMNRYGKWTEFAGENLGSGYTTGRDMVLQMLVDDGVPSRGHRKNILNPKFRTLNPSCPPPLCCRPPHLSFDLQLFRQ